ncbi:lamin tail domain-containing protein [Bacteroidota bacterium]
MKSLSVILCVILFFPLAQAQHNHKIFINEFLASNVSINADIVDFDDYSDWIELYNAENFDVDLGSYFITDNFNNPTRWQFPEEVNIPAKGYLLLWADGYDEIPGKDYTRDYFPYDPFTTKYYHLNFKLSRAGEEIALYAPDTSLVDSLSFGLQLRDVSWGRQPDGSPNWYYFGEPTPDTSNITAGVNSPEYTDFPSVSHESGFYSTDLTVALSTNSINSQIKYTLDGNRPTSSSETYSSPIHITETTVLRVRLFEENKLPGKIFTYSYFINERTNLSIISISTFPELLWDDSIGIYDNQYKSREIPISFEYFEPEGVKGFSLDAGLRMTGQASLNYPQKSFTVYARERYGTDAINYRVFPDRELDYFKSLYLRNSGVPDNRLTMFRDAALQSLVINKLDIDYQAYRPAVMFINGEYWGIYNIRDKINTNYLSSLYKINPDDIDLLEYNGNRIPEIMDGNRDDFIELINFFEQNDLSYDENYNYVKSKIDIDEYINYYITEIYYNNVFWLDQNVRFWKENKKDSKWRWILFDTDNAFGAEGPALSSYDENTLGHATYSVPNPFYSLWSTLTFRKLLDNKNFRTKFIQRFASCMNSVFYPDSVLSLINSFRNNLYAEMSYHINRWRVGGIIMGLPPIQNMFGWSTYVEKMKQFAVNRPQFQRQHIINYFGLSGNSELDISLNEESMGYVLVNDVEKIFANKTGIYFNDIPTILEAVPNVGYKFIGWSGLSEETIDSITIILNEDSHVSAIFEQDNVNIIPNNISSDLRLVSSNFPYYISQDVHVDSNVTLTIESGVEVLVSSNSSIVVYGGLQITGTESDPVIIKSNDYSDSWGGLCFVNATDSSHISNLIIENATEGIDFSRDRAAVSASNSVLYLDNIKVKNVNMPIFAQYGKITVKNSSLYSTVSGDLINIKYADYALVENCTLRGNDEFDTDAIDYDQIKNGVIRGNRIFNFYGFNSDAIDLGEDSQNILIEDNIVYNINDKGMSIGHGSSGIIKRNVIANCGQGVGIKDFNSYGYIEHNTFYGNTYAIACFEKNIGMGGGTAHVLNSILANSKISSLYIDDLSTINISFCLSNTNELQGIHNIFDEPDFINNFRLKLGSPAIDSGTPSLPPDPDGSWPDIGAYYSVPENQTNLIINEIHYNPFEGNEYEFIEIVNAGDQAVNLSGYKLTRSIDFNFEPIEISPDEYIVIAKNKTHYSGQDYTVLEWGEGSLSDDYGHIRLIDNFGITIDIVDYECCYWWPEEPNGTGPSLELHDERIENLVSSSWRSSYNYGGSPGSANIITLTDKIYINEFLASNNAVYADENGEFDDWIELYNDSYNSINIGGLYITDNLNIPCKYQVPNYSSDQTSILPQGHLLLWADGQTDQGITHLSFKLNKPGEQIGIVQVIDNDTLFIDSLTYGEQVTDVSFGRYPDGSDTWWFFDVPTPSDTNIILTYIVDNPKLPEFYKLFQNYPNPFNPTTKIKYTIPTPLNPPFTKWGKTGGFVELKVYDILGREVTTLVNEAQRPGQYEVTWDASAFSSGIYFYRIVTPYYSETKKMLILK